MTVKTSISLTDEQEAYARSLVERGRYSSLSAVLQHGLDMLRRDDEAHASKIQALQELIGCHGGIPFAAFRRRTWRRVQRWRASGPTGRSPAGCPARPLRRRFL